MQHTHPNSSVLQVLSDAYQPCPAFANVCTTMQWAPAEGHVPRGFCGATGSREEVRLILVCAEPGDPHHGEVHSSTDPMASAYEYVYNCFKFGKDPFHRNIRTILDMCFPNQSFDQQMKRAWITDSVLCSAKVEMGRVPSRVARECRRRYLEAQLTLFPNAVVGALGAKARDRMRGIERVIPAIAAAPPGCNRRDARDSWERIAGQVRGQAQEAADRVPCRAGDVIAGRCADGRRAVIMRGARR